jgi:uncharacterized protein
VNTYLDASALVKRYIQEAGRELVVEALAGQSTGITSVISGAEVPAAIAKAGRLRVISDAQVLASISQFWQDWPSLFRLRVDERLVRRAAEVAGQFGLRGYDSVHLASCLVYGERVQEPVRLATFDRQLSRAARELGMATLPDDPDGHTGPQT